MAIFSGFSRLLDALNEIASGLRALATAQRELGPAMDRLEGLERYRAQFEAEMQGLLLKADGKLKAANNAEARERALKRSYEKNLDTFDIDGGEVEGEAGIPPVHVAASESERVRPLRVDMARNNKTAAVTAKWAR